MFCVRCGQRLEDGWNVCPNCGEPVGENPTDPQQHQKMPAFIKWWFGAAMMIVVISLLAGLSFLLIRKDDPAGKSVANKQAEDIKRSSRRADPSESRDVGQEVSPDIKTDEVTPSIKESSREMTVTATPSEQDFGTDRVVYYSNGYWAMDLKSIDIRSKKVVYDGYEGGYSDIPSCSDMEGTIVDDKTLDIYGVQLVWDGDQSFTIHDAEDCMIFSSMAGALESHDVQHGAGIYRKMPKPEATPTDTVFPFVGIEGIYYDYSNGSGDPDLLNVRISDMTDTTFGFAIYQGEEIIFMPNTAEITGDTTGVYHGVEYTVYFSWPDVGTVYISGFQPAEGAAFINNAYYQVS